MLRLIADGPESIGAAGVPNDEGDEVWGRKIGVMLKRSRNDR
jgi:hypothetical protein